MLYLARTNKGDYDVQMYMRNHYSRPMGFVGRQLGSKWKETYSGQRVWDTSGELKPKHVFYRMNKEYGDLSSFTRLTSRKDFKQS